MALGTSTSALRVDHLGRTAQGVPAVIEVLVPVAPVAISIPSLIVSIPRTRAGT